MKPTKEKIISCGEGAIRVKSEIGVFLEYLVDSFPHLYEGKS